LTKHRGNLLKTLLNSAYHCRRVHIYYFFLTSVFCEMSELLLLQWYFSITFNLSLRFAYVVLNVLDLTLLRWAVGYSDCSAKHRRHKQSEFSDIRFQFFITWWLGIIKNVREPHKTHRRAACWYPSFCRCRVLVCTSILHTRSRPNRHRECCVSEWKR
jgi:hypothetical protein